jgi:hypothetical protein
MLRPLAYVLAAALVALRAAPAAAEPLDLDLARLGAPSASVWSAAATNVGVTLSPVAAQQLASDAKARFALLSIETALAFSSAILQPASTTGYSGFDFDMEASYAAVHPGAATGSATFPDGAGGVAFGPRSPWQTRGLVPHELFLPAFHVRKALPFSFELGGRMIYLSQSSYFGAQVEGKWALNEGFSVLPDLAVRAAYTQLFGPAAWNLSSTDVDVLVSKRWGVNAVTSFTPYAAARFTFVGASSDAIDFAPPAPGQTRTAAQLGATQAAFPTLRTALYRTTVGLRMTAYAVSLAAEATYLGGAKGGTDAPAADEYPTYRVPSSWSGAFRFGWEF